MISRLLFRLAVALMRNRKSIGFAHINHSDGGICEAWLFTLKKGHYTEIIRKAPSK